MRLELPYPPTVNTYYATYQGRRILSRRGRAYKKEVAAIVGPVQATDSRIRFTADLCPPDARKRDLDNTLKPLIDALTNAGVWVDDDQIKEIHARMLGKKSGGSCVVTITEI